MDGIDVRLVAIKGTSEVGAIIPGRALDERIVVAGYASNRCPGEQKVRNGGVARIGRAREGGPWHEMFDENGLEAVRGRKVLCERLKIVT